MNETKAVYSPSEQKILNRVFYITLISSVILLLVSLKMSNWWLGITQSIIFLILGFLTKRGNKMASVLLIFLFVINRIIWFIGSLGSLTEPLNKIVMVVLIWTTVTYGLIYFIICRYFYKAYLIIKSREKLKIIESMVLVRSKDNKKGKNRERGVDYLRLSVVGGAIIVASIIAYYFLIFLPQKDLTEKENNQTNRYQSISQTPSPSPDTNSILLNYKVDSANAMSLMNLLFSAVYNDPNSICPNIISAKISRKNAYYLYLDAYNSLESRYGDYSSTIIYIDNNLSAFNQVLQEVKDKCATAGYIIE